MSPSYYFGHGCGLRALAGVEIAACEIARHSRLIEQRDEYPEKFTHLMNH